MEDQDMRRDLTLGEMLGGLVFVVSGSRIVWVRTRPRGNYHSWSYSIADLRRYFAGNVTYWPVARPHQPRSTFNLWLDHKERLTVANRNDLRNAADWVNTWHTYAEGRHSFCPGPWPYL